ncbi:hypothetical protein [Photobacterium kishitanii]|uniref:Lipoprotein n=1 Tax=Photobacterium kishitanii TaxID=318456 RepID=A0A2T3KML7_9GAMM|nr:hypothetical protein [Photobacterium kishitanii]PSV01039.1 hypothetical protein C9J27_03145 [Photobacterium kishitanii]
MVNKYYKTEGLLSLLLAPAIAFCSGCSIANIHPTISSEQFNKMDCTGISLVVGNYKKSILVAGSSKDILSIIYANGDAEKAKANARDAYNMIITAARPASKAKNCGIDF